MFDRSSTANRESLLSHWHDILRRWQPSRWIQETEKAAELKLFMRKRLYFDRMGSRTVSALAAWAIPSWNYLVSSHQTHIVRWRLAQDNEIKKNKNKKTIKITPSDGLCHSANACVCMHVCDSQSLDASNDGVEGSLNICSRAGWHNGLALFMEQLGYILHRNTHERDTMS